MGSTALLTRLGDEAAEEVRRDLFDVLRTAVEVCGGSVVKGVGDGLMAVFAGREGDVLRCAVRMQRGVRRLGASDPSVELQLRVGVSRGEAIPSEGDWYGAVVNLAARLCAAAEPGAILVADAPLRWVPGDFRPTLGPVEHYTLKGFPEPVEARAIAWAPDDPGVRAPLPPALDSEGALPFVGRDELMDALSAAWHDTRAGGTRTVLVEGDPGIGVSRVLAEFGTIAWRDGAIVLHGRYGSPDGGDAIDQALCSWRAGPGETAVDGLRAKLDSGIGAVLVLDQLDLADPGEVDRALGLVTADLPTGVMVVLGARSRVQRDAESRVRRAVRSVEGSVELSLEPLRPKDVAALLTGVAVFADEPTRTSLAELLCVQTAGNPAEITTAINRLAEEGVLDHPIGQPHLAGVSRLLALLCPYQGLLPYQLHDADRFFGREDTVDALVERLQHDPFCAVVGASGSGKSSLVRAGLLPRLTELGWELTILTPGEHPVDTLTEVLPVNGMSGVTTALFVDQLEEAFTLCEDPEERNAFFQMLANGDQSTTSSHRVIVALRGDFFGRGAEHPDLASRLEDHTTLLGPLTEVGIRSAITRPSLAAGLTLEQGLVEVVLADVADNPGSLPLLSHALLETWKRRRGPTLTLDAYHEAGGVTGAIAQTAEALFTALDDAEQRTARVVMLRLTTVTDEGEALRRRASRTDLLSAGDDPAAISRVLEALADARLVVVGEDDVELAHEALVREWPRLRTWIDDDRARLIALGHLARATHDWDSAGRPDSDLYSGIRLDAAVELSHQTDALSATERAFIESSVARQDAVRRKERRTTRRLRRLLAVAAVAVVGALIGAGIAVNNGRRASANAERAEQSAIESEARGLAALSGQNANYQAEVALLLAVEGHRRDRTSVTESALLNALVRNSRLLQIDRDLVRLSGVSEVDEDGRFLAGITPKGELQLWDLHGALEVWTRQRPRGDSVDGIAFAPSNESKLATFGDTGLRLWDLRDGSPAAEPLERSAVDAAVFSHDAATLYSTSTENGPMIRAWSTGTGRLLWDEIIPYEASHLAVVPGAGSVLARTADGLTILSDEGNVRRDIAIEFKPLAIGSPPPPPPSTGEGGLAVREDGGMAAVTVEDDVLLYDLDTYSEIAALEGHSGIISDLRFSPDGRTLASAGFDKTVRLWDVDSARQVGETLLGHAGVVEWLSFVEDGRTLVSGTGSEVARWKVDGVGINSQLAAGGPVQVAASLDGATAASTDGGPTIVLWDIETGRRGEPIDTGASTVEQISLSPDGHRLAAFLVPEATQQQTEPPQQPQASQDPKTPQQTEEPRLSFWSLPDGSHVGDLPLSTPPSSPSAISVQTMQFAPDGTVLAVGTIDRGIGLIRFDGGRPRPLEVLGSGVDPTFTANGRELIAHRDESIGILRRWNVDTGTPLPPLHIEAESLGGLSLLESNGQVLALSAGSSVIFPSSRRAPLVGSGRRLTGLAVSADGSLLATIDESGQLALWDPASSQRIAEWPTDNAAGQVAFAGRTLLTSGEAGQLTTWDLRPSTWVRIACQKAGRNLTHEEWSRLVGGTYRRTCPQYS